MILERIVRDEFSFFFCIGCWGQFGDWVFNNFYLRGLTCVRKKETLDYFCGFTVSLSLCSVVIMEWSCFCLVLPLVALSNYFLIFCGNFLLPVPTASFQVLLSYPSLTLLTPSLLLPGITLLLNYLHTSLRFALLELKVIQRSFQ